MNKPVEHIFATRPTITLDFPLPKNTRILHPNQIILKIGNNYHDLGAFCYALRSQKKRKHREPSDVVSSSFLKQRPRQVLQLIRALSRIVTDGGKSVETVHGYAQYLKSFLDWADSNGLQDCLSGGNATRNAYLLWAEHTREQYRRQDFGDQAHNKRLRCRR